MLGVQYRDGNGVEKSFEIATNYYLQAAQQGHARAQNNLGNNYYLGRGVDRDFDEAFKWLSKAAEQGHTTSKKNMGMH